MWDLFAYNRVYDKNELAIYLNKAPDTILAYCEGELPLCLDEAERIIAFVSTKDPKDTTLIDVFAKPGKFIAIPFPTNGHTHEGDSIQELKEDLPILSGETLRAIKKAYSDRKIDRADFMLIEKHINHQIQTEKELLEKLRREVQ
jgi:hypothetical protein